MSSILPPIACCIDLQDQVLASSCPSEMVFHSEWCRGVSCLCPPRLSQKKAAFAHEGLRSPGTEQVLCSKWKFSQCCGATMAGSRFWGVETWTIWEGFFKKRNMNTQLGKEPWEGPWGLDFLSFPVNPPLVVTDNWCFTVGIQTGKPAYLRQTWTVFLRMRLHDPVG